MSSSEPVSPQTSAAGMRVRMVCQAEGCAWLEAILLLFLLLPLNVDCCGAACPSPHLLLLQAGKGRRQAMRGERFPGPLPWHKQLCRELGPWHPASAGIESWGVEGVGGSVAPALHQGGSRRRQSPGSSLTTAHPWSERRSELRDTESRPHRWEASLGTVGAAGLSYPALVAASPQSTGRSLSPWRGCDGCVQWQRCLAFPPPIPALLLLPPGHGTSGLWAEISFKK